MSMTRKDYELIAEALRLSQDVAAEDWTAEQMHRQVVHLLASTLRATNPRFNPGRFIEACGA